MLSRPACATCATASRQCARLTARAGGTSSWSFTSAIAAPPSWRIAARSQSLTGDVARADGDARLAYERDLQDVIDTAATGMSATTNTGRRAEAIALLALLSGGVSLARAVHDPELADEIAAAVRRAALRSQA